MNMINSIAEDIKSKKTLKDLPDEFVKNLIKEYIKNNPSQNYNNKKSKDYKRLFKTIRKQLHDIYEVFLGTSLETNLSTKERLLYYDFIYEKIFKITEKPSSILDLASGLNPLSYSHLKCKPNYVAYELSKNQCKIINSFFKKNKINGKAYTKNLFKINQFPKADITFLFKTLDSLETIRKDFSKTLLKKINSKFIIVSFPLKSLGGKKSIPKKKRSWFIKLLKKENYYYYEFEIPNEIFYIIKKQ